MSQQKENQAAGIRQQATDSGREPAPLKAGSPSARPGQPVIRVVDLAKSYHRRMVLDGISLDVTAGETLVIMGGSGCGKSTLLRLMAGLLIPDRGRVELFGQDLANQSDDELNKLRLRFGIVFQSGALFNSMTVGDNVALPLREHTQLDDETIDIIVKMKLEQVGLRQAAGLMPSELSGGMKKRAGLARAIALDPEILFYDEPSAGLDPVMTAEIDHLIMTLAGKLGVTSVVVTHEMESAFRIADRMAMLDRGRILRVGPRAEFESLRDGPSTGDNTGDTIRQFLRGDSEGPITARRISTSYSDDILSSIKRRTRWSWIGG